MEALLQTEREKAIKSLCGLLTDTTLNNNTRWQVAKSLGEILTEDRMPFVVAELQQYSESNIYAYKLIWNCAQVLSSPKFYRAWHGRGEMRNEERGMKNKEQ